MPASPSTTASEDVLSLLGDVELVGEVTGVIHADESSGFGVIELDTDDGYSKVAGPLAEVSEGQRLRVVGEWHDHPKHGETFRASAWQQVIPTTKAGVRLLLMSDRFGNMTPDTVEELLDAHGPELAVLIARDPDALVEQGMDDELAQALHQVWVTGEAFTRTVELCAAAGIEPDVARAIHAEHGADAPDLVNTDPYGLITVRSVRFEHVEALGQRADIDPLDPARIVAGLWQTAASRSGAGATAVARAECFERARAMLRVADDVLHAGVQRAVDAGMLTCIKDTAGDAAADLIGLAHLIAAEQSVADDVTRLNAAAGRVKGVLSDKVDDVAGLASVDQLTDDQLAAIRAVATNPVSVITGGPGSGKTTTMAVLAAWVLENDLELALAAPTGRASKRLEQATGVPAFTVHRLLGARPMEGGGGFMFSHDENDRIPHDVIVVDEMSMVDAELAASLLCAIDDGSHFVLVGDPDQLPPVGPGDILRDLIRCADAGTAPVAVTRLEQIHRQAAGSRIVSLAREVTTGTVGPLKGADGDVFMAEQATAGVVARVVRAVSELAPEHFGVTPEQIQVLVPQYRGPVGVDRCNEALRDALNPKASVSTKEIAGFRVGDRVIETRNDAERDVWNGDIGEVTDTGRDLVKVAFERGETKYSAAQARSLRHAWAITVHKSQGGEWPVVVLVVDRQHSHMLWRNMLHTAVTRASQALIIVGQHDTFVRAAARPGPTQRTTCLPLILQAGA